MTASAIMSLGVRAMFANYAGLQTSGHNIANAGVDGYSRQQVELQTAIGQFTGSGFIGKGVDVKTITRLYDQFLSREAMTSRSQSQFDAARLDRLQQLEAVFAGGDNGIGQSAGALLNSMVDLANKPQDMAARSVVLGRAGELASRFSAAASQLDDIQSGVTQDLRASVAHVNESRPSWPRSTIASRRRWAAASRPTTCSTCAIACCRTFPATCRSPPSPPTTARWACSSAAASAWCWATRRPSSTSTPDPYDASRMAVSIVDSAGTRPLSASLIGAGSIGGLLRFQDDDLVRARTLLGQLGSAVAGSLNAQQALGLDLRVPPSTGAPLFTIGAPQAQPAATNARTAGGAFVSNVTLTVTDATQLQASEYELVQSAGAWQLTRRSDGFSQTVVDGSVVDGFQINLGVPPPAATDRFLLQPVTYAANSMTRALDDPRGIAAASPVTATAAADQWRHCGDRRAHRGEPERRSEPDRDHHLHVGRWRLRLGIARPRDQCVAVQRQRHLERRPTDRAQRLRVAAVGRAVHGRCVHGGADHLSRHQQRQCAGDGRHCAMRCWSGAWATAPVASPAAWASPTHGRRRWPTSACARKAHRRHRRFPRRWPTAPSRR